MTLLLVLHHAWQLSQTLRQAISQQWPRTNQQQAAGWLTEVRVARYVGGGCECTLPCSTCSVTLVWLIMAAKQCSQTPLEAPPGCQALCSSRSYAALGCLAYVPCPWSQSVQQQMVSVVHQSTHRCNLSQGEPCDVAPLHMQVYYHNPSTGESSWQKPEGFQGDAGSAGAAPVPISSEQIPNTGWSEVTCSDGRKYYYHAAKEVCACQPGK